MTVTDIFDLQTLASRRIASAVYCYIENGGYEEETLRRNRRDLESLAFVPRALNDVSDRKIGTRVGDEDLRMPVILAPVGACGLAHPNGEIEAAKAAQEFGVPFCLSTLSICTIEDVAEAISSPFWFQLYVMRDRKVTDAMVQRAKDAGCSTLLLSMDLHVRSQRHAEQKHGLKAPPRIDLGTIWDGLTHPAWTLSMLKSKRKTFGNLIGYAPHAKNVFELTPWLEEQFDSTLSLKDVDWARKVWPGKLFVKGIMHPEDARACIDHGADGVILSNHGGRQVDGAVSTFAILPQVVDAVDGKGIVLADSGIRSGIDLLKMLARGADACLIGRAYMYGLAAMGGRGVHKALEIICKELDQTMGLCGCTDVNDLPADLLVDDHALMSWGDRAKSAPGLEAARSGVEHRTSIR